MSSAGTPVSPLPIVGRRAHLPSNTLTAHLADVSDPHGVRALVPALRTGDGAPSVEPADKATDFYFDTAGSLLYVMEEVSGTRSWAAVASGSPALRGKTDMANYPAAEQVLRDRLPVVLGDDVFTDVRVEPAVSPLFGNAKYVVVGDAGGYAGVTVAELDAGGRYLDGPGAAFGGTVPAVGTPIACGGEIGGTDGDALALLSDVPALEDDVTENSSGGVKSSGVWSFVHGLLGSLAVAWDSVTGRPPAFPPEAHTHTKSQIDDFPASMTPAAHAASHKSDGGDRIAPADIGAEPGGAVSAHDQNGSAHGDIRTALDGKLDKGGGAIDYVNIGYGGLYASPSYYGNVMLDTGTGLETGYHYPTYDGYGHTFAATGRLGEFNAEAEAAVRALIDDRLPIPISAKSAGFTTESYKRFIVTVSDNMTVSLHTPTSGEAEIFECRFDGTSLSADKSIAFVGATATTMDTNCGTVTAGKVALMSAFWNGSTWDVNWKVEG